MRLLLLLALGLSLHASRAQEDEDGTEHNEEEEEEGDDDDSVIDNCNFYDTDHAGGCSNRNFSNLSPLAERYGNKLVTCCEGHSYLFIDSCEERVGKRNNLAACRKGPGEVVPPRNSVSCPRHCRTVELEDSQFDIVRANGSLVTRFGGSSAGYFRGATVVDYCAAYHCGDSSGELGSNSRRWKVKADVCLCLNEDPAAGWREDLWGVDKCCPRTTQMEHRQDTRTITCPRERSDDDVTATKECKDGEWKRAPLSLVNVTEPRHALQLTESFAEPLNRSRLCAGLVLKKTIDVARPLLSPPYEAFLAYCDKPCGGRTPCFRTCCNSDERFGLKKPCEKMMGGNGLDKYFGNEAFEGMNVSSVNLATALPASRNNCSKGFKIGKPLRPSERCLDQFALSSSSDEGEGRSVLKWLRGGGRGLEGEEISQFCLYFEGEEDVSAEVCVRDRNDQAKFNVYPYVLLTSSFFLLLTLIVYTAYPKLLNTATRLLRHFVINMFFAFVCLSVNQLFFLADDYKALCMFSAFAQQYFFLTAFNFMTIKSIEISLLMSGRLSGSKRYRTEMLCGYGIPLAITILTAIVEVTAPRCSAFRPRFTEEKCFFAEKSSKILWFYAPISVMLLVNLCMFVSSVISYMALKDQSKGLHLRDHEKRSDKTEKFIVYLKLFVGMGLIWIFEIIAGLADVPQSYWYLTDILNMCQGVYIFIVSVCKRNVLEMIFGKECCSRMCQLLCRKGGRSQKRRLQEKESGTATNYSESSTKATDIQLSTFRQNSDT